jgi:hypothetical protein
MPKITFRRSAALLAAVVGALSTATPASAAHPVDFTLPAGFACPGFDVRIQATPDDRVVKEFTDKSGKVVRSILAGTGSQVTLTNQSTLRSLTLPSNGAVSRTVYNADGTRTVTATGHQVLILFPTDVPAGPSTTLFVGRVVYTADAFDNFVVQSTSGKTRDLCAELASTG